MKKYKYITTTLPYINSKPHIGHALEFIQADALARWFRQTEHDVYFNVGVDEHGSKVYNESVKLNRDVREYCDEQANLWMEFCGRFAIDYSNFYRTSSPHHYKQVQAFWKECVDRGDIYKGTYKGLYCVGCESRKLDKDLINGKCPDHGVAPEMVDEVNWFFKLTNYKEALRKWLTTDDKFLLPQSKTTELLNLIDEAEDISISRDKKIVPWGVPVPDDDTQTIYVWFEALLNYIMSVNPHYPGVSFSESQLFEKYWGDSIQLCGPDNIRFQGCIFQAFLESAGLPHTTRLLVHGTVTGDDGTKMSKTKGNVVDPIDQIEKFGLDAVRYYALGGLSTFYNSAWVEKDLIATCNNDIADNYGNLLYRTMHLRMTKGFPIGSASDAFKEMVFERTAKARAHWDALNISAAIKEVQEMLVFGNKYMNDREPWKNPDTAEDTLNNLYALLMSATFLLYPVIPDVCSKAQDALEANEKVILFQKIIVEYGK